MSQKSRSGLTLIEVLVVIFIVGILAALLLPAIQSMQEAARRIQCTNNLKQIGLAIHSYHDSLKLIPFGRISTYDKEFVGENPPCTSLIYDKSFLILLLPYMEQQNLYNSINQDVSILSRCNTTVQSTVIANLSCPSDSESRARSGAIEDLVKLGFTTQGDPMPMFFTSYSACFGSYDVNALPNGQSCPAPSSVIRQVDGCINDLQNISLSSITDGLSQTMIATEKSTASFRRFDEFDPEGFRRYGWYFQGNWGDTLMTTFYKPNKKSLSVVGNVSVITKSASSSHRNGVNALLCDGSVKFISDTVQSWQVDPVTGIPLGAIKNEDGSWSNLPKGGIWQSLATRAGGELLNQDGY